MPKTESVSNETVFFVRGGKRHGCYLTARIRPSKTRRVYAWTNKKAFVAEMNYNQARSAAKTYGGQVVKRVYKNNEIVTETAL